MNDRIGITALAAIAGVLGHHGGDYLMQDDCMAKHKQMRTARGRRELALHASTYAATQAATRATLYRAAGARVPLRAQVATAIVECVLHAVIDDGRLLRRFSRIGRGLRRFTGAEGEQLGRQENFHDNAPGGRALMDQAMHHQVQIVAGTVVTALMS